MTYLPKTLAEELVEAALDQPHPTDRLKAVLRTALHATNHKDAVK